MFPHIFLQLGLALKVLHATSALIHFFAHAHIHKVLLHVVELMTSQCQTNPQIVIFLAIPVDEATNLLHLRLLIHHRNEVQRTAALQIILDVLIFLGHNSATHHIRCLMDKLIDIATHHCCLRVLLESLQLHLEAVRHSHIVSIHDSHQLIAGSRQSTLTGCSMTSIHLKRHHLHHRDLLAELLHHSLQLSRNRSILHQYNLRRTHRLHVIDTMHRSLKILWVVVLIHRHRHRKICIHFDMIYYFKSSKISSVFERVIYMNVGFKYNTDLNRSRQRVITTLLITTLGKSQPAIITTI